MIDWSWQLLTGPEQTVLRRLAVHSGGCTMDAAEAVCAAEGVASDDVLDLLAGLVDRSLAVRVNGDRFRLLESVAAYCLDRLREAGEEVAVRRRHADHYLALAERAEPQLRGSRQREWLRRLDAESANLRVALDTFRRDGAAEPALRLAIALVWHWFMRGRLTEARLTLDAALAVAGNAPAALRAGAEAWRTGLAIRQGQGGPDQAAEALRAYEKVADPIGRAWAEWFLAASTGRRAGTADPGGVRHHRSGVRRPPGRQARPGRGAPTVAVSLRPATAAGWRRPSAVPVYGLDRAGLAGGPAGRAGGRAGLASGGL